MNLLESLTALLAPHLCLVCHKESAPVCQNCAQNCFEPPKSTCYKCQKETINFATCPGCQDHSSIKHVWVASDYSGPSKDLIAMLKFQRVKAAAKVIAERLDDGLPDLPDNSIIVPVPTANGRIRVRGYDQAELIAQDLARRRKLHCRNLLRRLRTTRQVGSGRRQRFEQLQDAFVTQNLQVLRGHPVLLVDDVLTTGATLESAAKTLAQAGVRQINAAVLAH
jgi:ComF family protein